MIRWADHWAEISSKRIKLYFQIVRVCGISGQTILQYRFIGKLNAIITFDELNHKYLFVQTCKYSTLAIIVDNLNNKNIKIAIHAIKILSYYYIKK